MSRLFTYGSFAALMVATAFACGSAQAQQLAAAAPPQRLIAPPPAPAAAPGTPEDQHDDASIPDENAQLPPRFQTQVVDYPNDQPRGTIIVDTPHTYLYYTLNHRQAIRYGIGVGRAGFTWSGVKHITNKREWPDWYPPPEMIQRQPYLPRMMAGGPGNPLGSRALYIGHTEYRIHGTNDPTSIGKDVSSGCIHLTNDNAIDLFNRVKVGTKVIVLPQTPPVTREAGNGQPTTPGAGNPPPAWQAKAAAAIAASDPDAPRPPAAVPVPASDQRMSWARTGRN